MVIKMFNKRKINIKIDFDIESGDMKVFLKPKETRPSKALLILGQAQMLIEKKMSEEVEEEKEAKYIA